MAVKMGVAPGDKLTLTTARGKATAFGTVPTRRAFQVAGIFNVGMYEYDSSFVFMPLDAAAGFLAIMIQCRGWKFMLRSRKTLQRCANAIGNSVGSDLRVFDWLDRNRSFLNALRVERNVMFLILTLIILVAAFNIISSMIMLVRSKNADIAVLRAMGASGASIMRVFVMTGASIGIFGTLAGTIVGVLFCWNIDSIKQAIESLSGAELFAAEIYFLSNLPAKIDTQEVLMVIADGAWSVILASLYPAWRASRVAQPRRCAMNDVQKRPAVKPLLELRARCSAGSVRAIRSSLMFCLMPVCPSIRVK